MDHRGVRKRNEVDGGAGGRGLVDLHGGHGDVQRRQGHGIRAEAAAKIGDVADAGLGKALRVPRRHVEPGGLFQAGLGEEHLPGELAELGLGPGPEP